MWGRLGETITETRGILSIYVIIDTSLLIYGVTRDTVQCAGRKNLEGEGEDGEEAEEWSRRKREGTGERKRTRRQGRSFPLR